MLYRLGIKRELKDHEFEENLVPAALGDRWRVPGGGGPLASLFPAHIIWRPGPALAGYHVGRSLRRERLCLRGTGPVVLVLDDPGQRALGFFAGGLVLLRALATSSSPGLERRWRAPVPALGSYDRGAGPYAPQA